VFAKDAERFLLTQAGDVGQHFLQFFSNHGDFGDGLARMWRMSLECGLIVADFNPAAAGRRTLAISV
jgi:hypothetical protein